MRLYHRTNFIILWSLILLLLSIGLWGCTVPQGTQGLITVNITADKNELQIKISSGSTVQEALKSAQITLGEMDRVELPLYTVLSDESNVKVIRIKEESYTEQVIIPFEHQELRNEALPEGESRLSQPGVNGLEEFTYQRVFENDIEVSNTLLKSVVLKKSLPEVVMIGSRSKFLAVDIPGRIAYLSAGNAWVIENTTSNRRCIVSTGDLDGRIFSLSKNGDFLLFTRFSSDKNTVNSLWVALLNSNPVKLIDLGVHNVVHFAEFDPGSSVVAYSTSEWRETAPGWQANNDLYELDMSENGSVGTPRLDKESSSGGVYGWWGMEYFWSPDKLRFLYSRPDSIGIIDSLNGTQTSIFKIAPYQTGGNWAWVPGAAWSPDGKVVYTVDHTSSGDNSGQEYQVFDLLALPMAGGTPVDLVKNVGMFAYPVPSPMDQNNNIINNISGDPLHQNVFSVAYLQAIFPDQSETSGYRLSIIDRDGSNQKSLFPEEGSIGLEPQHVVWSPTGVGIGRNYAITLIYNGDIWMVDTISGIALQITGDGLTSRVDWR